MTQKLLHSATEALRRVLRFDYPADSVLSHYFSENRALGQSDRAFVAEVVFGVLRHKRVLEHLAANVTPRRLLLGWLGKFSETSARELTSVLKAEELSWVEALKAEPLDDLAPAVQAELPDWIWERLAGKLPTHELIALGRALQEPAPLDLRVNTLKADRDSVLGMLRESGLAATATPYSPFGVRVDGRPGINRHPLFVQGAIEVQDEGSQLIGLLLAPRRHDLVVDFCAGAGGKALMLCAMMRSQGRVYAFDVSQARLERLKVRLKRSGVSNLHPQLLQNERDTKVIRLRGKIDRVLVDAPCSGLGTLRRNPDLKWRQSPHSIAEMRARQTSILSAAATLVKSGGRLVYATCSLLQEENEDIVHEFLRNQSGFALVPCPSILESHAVRVDAGECMQLWPHVHGTDGFFGAVFKRD